MKKILVVLAVFLGLTVPVRAEWLASGVVANPSVNQVILEKVATVDAEANVCIKGAASVAAVFRVQHRNAANDTTIREQLLPVSAATIEEFCITDMNHWLILQNERLRVTMFAAIVGSASVSMLHNIP